MVQHSVYSGEQIIEKAFKLFREKSWRDLPDECR